MLNSQTCKRKYAEKNFILPSVAAILLFCWTIFFNFLLRVYRTFCPKHNYSLFHHRLRSRMLPWSFAILISSLPRALVRAPCINRNGNEERPVYSLAQFIYKTYTIHKILPSYHHPLSCQGDFRYILRMRLYK